MEIQKMHDLENKTSNIINNHSKQLKYIETINNKENDYLNIRERFVKAYLKKQEDKLVHMYKSKLKSVVEEADKLRVEYDHLRKSTVPFNYLWYWFIKRNKYKEYPLAMQKGVHFIVALMGGGKSSFIYHTIERLRDAFGFAAYVNVDIEHPHYDPVLKEYMLYHKRFDESEFWGPVTDEETGKTEFTQLKRFNPAFTILVLDEWLSKMNHRNNNTKDYKDMFIPFTRSLLHMRHQGMTHVYVASQLDSTDVQLIGLFKYLHEVEIDLDISYKEWVRTGKLDKHVRGWMVYTYELKRSKGKTDKVLKKKWYEDKVMDMIHFNSLNQSYLYNNLITDNIKIRRSHT